MANVMMMLGPFPFGIRTAAYEELTRQSSWRWASQERLRRRPAQQYIGPGADEITLTGEIMPHFKGGLWPMEALRAMAGRGKPMLLVDGRGHVWGDWVVTGLEEARSIHNADGTPNVIAFTLTLREYGRDHGIGGALATGIAAISALSRLF